MGDKECGHKKHGGEFEQVTWRVQLLLDRPCRSTALQKNTNGKRLRAFLMGGECPHEP